MPGFPDYQQYAIWREDPQVNVNQNFPQGNNFLGPFTISHYSSILINCILQNNQLTLTIEFSNDPAFSSILVSYPWLLTINTQLLVTIPASAPYWRAHLFCPVAGNTGVQLMVMPTNVGPQDINYPVLGNSIVKSAVSIPANSSVIYPLPYIQGGAASAMLNDDDGTGHLVAFVYQQTAAGGIGSYTWRTKGAGPVWTDLLYLPDTPCSFVVLNQDAGAAHSFHGSLIPGGPT